MTPARHVHWLVLAGVFLADLILLLPGWWWTTSLVAGAVAAALRGGRVLAAILAGTLAGWVAATALRVRGALGGVADLVGALAINAPGYGWTVLVATVLTALLLAGAGAWCGAALRRSLAPALPAAIVRTPVRGRPPPLR
ncbi:hypothetical protein [Jidongwangia harbinensis]|uniref:hypothetical protein n=1 Tax=Jidongwangia harbinensis TaxID=2878561 RepID=UPI001CDA1605|nr:hypothetical protein [Jidongwangia harbinensis]MCA2219341.1 hypothetical protein [Jidongwangia harbinensis]